jgi:tetratricopeptide (TPR) repeat protein
VKDLSKEAKRQQKKSRQVASVAAANAAPAWQRQQEAYERGRHFEDQQLYDRAIEAYSQAIELDPKSSNNYVSHGVGNYYLPPAFGGGIDLAIKDFRKAIELDPKNADAWLWLGIALRRVDQPEEARQAIAKSLELNPSRMWAKQQLDKTPVQ